MFPERWSLESFGALTYMTGLYIRIYIYIYIYTGYKMPTWTSLQFLFLSIPTPPTPHMCCFFCRRLAHYTWGTLVLRMTTFCASAWSSVSHSFCLEAALEQVLFWNPGKIWMFRKNKTFIWIWSDEDSWEDLSPGWLAWCVFFPLSYCQAVLHKGLGR